MSAASGLGIEGQLPSLGGAVGWLNSEPVKSSELRGRVVVFDFWTYTCINWIRSLPYVRAWAEKYSGHGLVVIGVHTPEFEFEKDVDNIRRAAAAMRVDYPIAIDSDYAVWRAFSNRYWPALYFVDAEGAIRHHAFGEGDYGRSEIVIQRLLGEAGTNEVPDGLVTVEARGVEAAADWRTLRTPETYLGYLRAEGFASAGGAVLDVPHVYAAPEDLRLNRWALAGEWTIQGQPAVLNRADGRIVHRFEARDVHLVMAPAQDGAPVRFRVLIDGHPPNGAHGLDIDEHGAGTVIEPRLYQLIRQPGRVTEHTFEIVFLDAGVQACVFTFG
jgi:thiol-disulfide isomerase/thioredoxin